MSIPFDWLFTVHQVNSIVRSFYAFGLLVLILCAVAFIVFVTDKNTNRALRILYLGALIWSPFIFAITAASVLTGLAFTNLALIFELGFIVFALVVIAYDILRPKKKSH